jgi:molybdopterin synthase catalytic subunit
VIRLQREPIEYAALVEMVRCRAAGAIVLFLGTVRELTGEQITLALEYEAYVPLAEKHLAQIEAEMRQRWNITEAVLVHRLGRLEPGEVSVAVAVSAPHRQEAFLAARHGIERIKEIVPIWKKEHWADGASQWIHPSGTSAAPQTTSSPASQDT